MTRNMLVTAIILAISAVSALADGRTAWQGDTGDWFDAANWTDGVPASDMYAFINNGGTAEINGGLAQSRLLWLGHTGAGSVTQAGGVNDIAWALVLGGQAGSQGNYMLMGGSLSEMSAYIGYGQGQGQFTQIGGVHEVQRTLNIGVGAYRYPWHAPRPSGTYDMVGGQLTTVNTTVGATGHGRFIQSGGVHNVDGMLRIGGGWGYRLRPVAVEAEAVITPLELADSIDALSLARPIYSRGYYELSGGQLTAQQQQINRTGTMRQTGGINTADYLAVRRGGRYDYFGGTLNVEDGFDLRGVLNFGDSSVSLAIDDGLLNFGRGSLLGGENASITAGEDSLVIFAAGFDPETDLGSFQTQGLVHYAGRDLVLTADQGFTGWGTIDDHVETKGHITASEGGRIDLRRGLFVHEGRVDLGHGQLTVRNDRSGIRSGELSAGSMSIGASPWRAYPYPVAALSEAEATAWPIPARFVQRGGATRISGGLTVGLGAYEMQDGRLSAGRISLGGWSPFRGTAVFEQSGGCVDVDGMLQVGGPFLVAAHWEEAFPLPVELSLELTEAFDTEIVPHLERLHYMPLAATYNLSDGHLHAGALSVGGRGTAAFRQSGGSVAVENALTVRGRAASYTITGGNLKTATLAVGSQQPGALYGNGMLEIGQNANVYVSRQLSFGHNSMLLTEQGSTIHLTGGPSTSSVFRPTFEILSTDASAMAGLNDLTVIFEGGSSYWATMEVAGEDMGFTNEGFVGNFALDTLQIGGDDVARVKLVDLFDNQVDWNGVEALYVDTLIVNEGSLLYLNGLNIYYRHGIFGGGLILDNATVQALPVPEPMTLAVLAAGSLALLRRRSR